MDNPDRELELDRPPAEPDLQAALDALNAFLEEGAKFVRELARWWEETFRPLLEANAEVYRTHLEAFLAELDKLELEAELRPTPAGFVCHRHGPQAAGFCRQCSRHSGAGGGQPPRAQARTYRRGRR